jgi:hypothetical protein
MDAWFLQGDQAAVPTDISILLLSLMMAFLAGQLIAWIYMYTHAGLSYSRSFVNALVMMPVLVAMVMLVMANSLVTAFGLMAVFAIVRFRNILRDTLDTTYILAAIVIGMACGTQKYTTAVIGAAVVSFLMLYLYFTAFGSRHRYDLIVNLHWSRPLSELPALGQLLERHARKTHCASQRSNEGYEGTDLSYRLLLRNSERVDDLLTELRALAGVSRVTSLKAEEESEL